MSVNSKLFSYDNLVHAISGAVGSMVGMVVFYPFDTVRCRLQLDDSRKAKNTFKIIMDIAQEEGIWSLYRGMVPVLQSICASNFVYFYIYRALKSSASAQEKNKDLVLASLAGIINVLLTTPLWMVNTRMKMSGVTHSYQYKSLLDGLLKVVKNEGAGTLWAGTLPSLLLVSNPAIHMAVYQAIKRRVPEENLGALSYFLISAVAKMVATVATYPLQLVQTKLRHGHSSNEPGTLPKDAGTLQLFLYLLKRQGIPGLYKGMEAKLWQTVLTTALMFTAYEKIAIFVLTIMKGSKSK
uniref:Peroxisomal membrane protein PMP34 n=1 Tax=Lygus hesperus TaxID=30085 RepID=A0A0A9W6D0_LYGHE